MEPWQLKRVRDGLQAFRALGREDGGPEYSWPSVEEAIFDETGVRVPEDRLNKFVIGEPHRDPAKKSQGIRHFPLLSEKRLEAVIRFLTVPESTGFIFPREDLERQSPSLHGLSSLDTYLSATSRAVTVFQIDRLHGRYHARPLDHGAASRLLLTFGPQKAGNLSEARLQKIHLVEPAPPDDLMNDPEALGDIATSHIHYRGAALLTPEEALMVFVKKESTGENLILLSLAFDNAFYFDERPGAFLVLLEHENPEDGNAVTSAHDARNLVAAIKEGLGEKIHIFQRFGGIS